MKILRQQISLKDFDQEDIYKFYLYAGKDLYDKYEMRSTTDKLNNIKRGSFKVSDLPKEVEINFPANNRNYKSGSLISVWDHKMKFDRQLDIPLYINDGIITFPEGSIYRPLASILPKYHKKDCGWEYKFVRIGNYPPKPIITVPLRKEGWVSLYKAFLEFLIFLRLFYGSEFKIFLDPEKTPALYQKQFSIVATLVPSILNLGLAKIMKEEGKRLSIKLTTSYKGKFNESVYKKIINYVKKNYQDLIIVNLGTGSFYTNPANWNKEQIDKIKKHGDPERKRTILDWILWAYNNNKHVICYSELDTPIALAHEIGHYLIDKAGGTKAWLQSNGKRNMFNSKFISFVAFCCGLAGNTGELVGIVSNFLLRSPLLYIEFLASYNGYQVLTDCGVSENDLKEAKEMFRTAWGTYLSGTINKSKWATYGKLTRGGAKLIKNKFGGNK